MKNYTVEFEVQPGIYQNLNGDYIEASSPSEALTIALQRLVDNGMDPMEVILLSVENKVREEGYDRVWTF